MVRTPHDSPIMTVGVFRGGVCGAPPAPEGCCGDCCWLGDIWFLSGGSGPPITSGLTPLMRCCWLMTGGHTIRWGGPCCCWWAMRFGIWASFLTRNSMAASRIGLRSWRAGDVEGLGLGSRWLFGDSCCMAWLIRAWLVGGGCWRSRLMITCGGGLVEPTTWTGLCWRVFCCCCCC